MKKFSDLDYDSLPDPRSNYWSAKDDACVFYILAICPFIDIKRNIKMLPRKTSVDIYDRFKKIMKTPQLQDRLMQRFSGNFVDDSLPFSESEIYAMSKIFRDSHRKAIDTVAGIPYLFNPIRTPDAIFKQVIHMKKKLQLNDYQSNYYIRRYLTFVKKIRSIKTVHSYHEKIQLESGSLSKKLKNKPIEYISNNKSFDDIETFLNSQFRSSDLAILFGFMSIHKIQNTRVIVGRQSPKVKVDINLSMYCMQTVCRQHCGISFCSDGKFYLTVFGRDVFINGELFYKNQNIQLKNHDIIDVGGIPLMFVENPTFRMKVNALFENKINSSS